MSEALPKRSLFKKPTWSKTQTTVDPVDLFSRSKDVYQDIVAEEERKRQKKIEKRAKADWKGHGSKVEGKANVGSEDNSNWGGEDEDDSEDDLPKRRKAKPIPLSDSDDENSRPPPPPADDDDYDEDEELLPFIPKNHQEFLDTQTASQGIARQFPSEPILLSDGEDDHHIAQHNTQTPKYMKLSLTESTPVDPKFIEHGVQTSDAEEEFPELARKARERARLNRIEAETAAPEPSPSEAGYHKRPSSAQPQPTPVSLDPIVHIFISSRIPNTQPLIVNRRIGQRLRDVRLTWCERQGNAVEKAAVFLTWKGKRVFDVTTCKSLGINADEEGNVTWKGHEDGLGGDNRVHMEAMTEEILREAQKDRNAGVKYVGSGNAVQNVEKEPKVDEKSKVEESVKLTLKSQGYQDFRLIVKPSTLIARMIYAFRQARKVSEERQVYLLFDGDKLDPEVTVADTELGDMDHVDVYVR